MTKEFQEWQRQLALLAAISEVEDMTKKEAWSFLEEHLPENAGYDACEEEEMADYIAEYDEAIEVVRAACCDTELNQRANARKV